MALKKLFRKKIEEYFYLYEESAARLPKDFLQAIKSDKFSSDFS